MFDTVPSKRGRLSGKEERSAELVPRLRPLLKTLIPHPAPVDGAGFGLPHHSDLYGLWGRRQPYRWGARHLAGNRPNPLPASALDGHLLGTVTHQTMPVHMLMSGNHHDTVQFHILRSPKPPLLLGYPWLHRHNLHIDWKTGSILGWSPSCRQVCIRQVVAPLPPVSSCSVPDSLSGRRMGPWGHASPTGGLNNITVKNRYRLPLITSAFELLQGATIFTKLDLHRLDLLLSGLDPRGGWVEDRWICPSVIKSIWSCPLASPTPRPSSRPTLTT